MRKNPGGSARTSEAVRRAIQQSQESLRTLANRYGINPKTVAKWKRRKGTDDLPRGPKPNIHRRLTTEEEEIIVRFREHTLLPLDDCLYALQARIPHPTRSSLHRCLRRHGINRLDSLEDGGHPAEQQLRRLGCLDIGLAEVRSADGTHYLFSAIDEASKFVFVQMRRSGGAAEAASFLTEVVEHFPVRVRCVRTPEGLPFLMADGDGEFNRSACKPRGIVHEVTKSPSPWSQGGIARMEPGIRDAIMFSSKLYIEQLLREFVHAYNFRRRLKSLKGRTPYGFIRDAWQSEPHRFLREPHHEMLGLEIAPGPLIPEL